MNPNNWLKATVLSQCDLRFSDERPLYAYRCSTVLFEKMAESLTPALTHLSGRQTLDDAWSSMYCLYAAEWWRRNHEAGTWSWSGIDASLGWQNFSHTERYKLLRIGMKWWKREIMKRHDGDNLYLVTIACEGGLPLKLLHRENTNLSRYFKALLKERQLIRHSSSQAATDTGTLAEDQRNLLPATLQNDVVYELSGQLIDAVSHCRQLLGEASKHPLEQLDSIEPDWRDAFPLLLEDGVAQSLIADLLAERLTPKRQTQRDFCEVTRRLVRTASDQWQPELSITLPAKIKLEALLDQLELNDEATLPVHLEFRAQLGDAEHSIAVLSQLASGNKAWRVSMASGGSDFRVKNEAALEELSLRIVAGPKEYAQWTPDSSASPADDLPWIYVCPVGATGANAKQLELVGCGTLTTREATLFAVVPSEWQIPATDNCCSLGALGVVDRQVYQLQEAITLQSSAGDSFTIEPGAEADDLPNYRVLGSRTFWNYHKRPVYAGAPHLSIQTEDNSNPVPAAEMFWRPAVLRQSGSPQSSWTSFLDKPPLGDVRIRHRSEKGVRFESCITVVPKQAEIRIKTGQRESGMITLNGFELSDCAVENASATDIDVQHNDTSVQINFTGGAMNASEVGVSLYWQDASSVTLNLPVPLENAAFIKADGSRVDFQSTVSIDELMGLRAMAVSPRPTGYHLEVELQDPTMSRNIANACNHRASLELERGVYNLPLGPMSPRLRRLMALRSSLDCAIHLTLSNSVNSRITVKRFQTRLLADWETGELQLADNIDIDPAAIVIEAISLVEPAEKSTLSYYADAGNWSAKELSDALAPWIVVAWHEGSLIGRPTVAPVTAVWSEEGDGKTPAGFRKIMQESDFRTRNDLMAKCVTSMAGDPNHDGWPYLKRCLTEFAEYPPNSFDFTMRLSENPWALATGLFAITGNEKEDYWQLADKMGFDWRLLPLGAWVKSAVIHRNNLQQKLPDDLKHLALEQTRKSLEDIARRLPEFDMLMHCIADLLEGKSVPQPMVIAFDAQSAVLIGEAQEQLLIRHANNPLWPDESQLENWQPGDSLIKLREYPARSQFQSLRDYRQAVVDAPLDAGLQLAADQLCGPDQNSYFIAFREFDTEWFDTTLGTVMAWGFLNRDWTDYING